MEDHKPLRIQSGSLRADILPWGASLVGVRFSGDPRNLVMGFADPAQHRMQPVYAGALVGPVAGRLRGGRCEIAGHVHQMPRNEGGRTTLHSGPEGLHAQLWRVQHHSSDSLTLACPMPDGACGLSGTQRIDATYSIKNNRIQLTLHAETDRPTAMNIAAHPYWNLDGRATIADHLLKVAATTYLPLNAENLPTGDIEGVAGTVFDFTQAALVPCIPDLDVNFCLAQHRRSQPQHAATLTGGCGTRLDIHTTEAGLQVYNGAFLPDAPIVMADAPAMQPYSGVALEPQGWPDAPNHPQFPQITLMPDQPYRQITTFTLTPP